LTERFRFRVLTDDDLPLLHRWLNEPGVVRFWEGEDVSWEAVVADYGSENDEPIEQFIAELNSQTFGWIQCYCVADFVDDPDEDEVRNWLALGFDPQGAGIDYIVGDPTRRGQGLGSAMIRQFTEEIVFGQHGEWATVGASPVRANPASCGALAKAGFDHVASFEDEEVGVCDLYTFSR